MWLAVVILLYPLFYWFCCDQAAARRMVVELPLILQTYQIKSFPSMSKEFSGGAAGSLPSPRRFLFGGGGWLRDER